MSNSEERPHKKRNMEPSPSSSLLSSLPDDVALNCLARVSRVDRAALSLTSKSYRSLVASQDLYKTRSLIGRTETYVYVCLRTPPPNPNLGWYILRRRNGSSDLIPIPSLPSQPPEESSVVALDWGIYVIGGLINGKPTSDVWLLDCRTHTWRSVPSMGVARANAATGVVDGKIYVLGGCDTVKWGEVFDPKTQTWETLPLIRKKGSKDVHGSLVRDQKVYLISGTNGTFYYSPSEEGEWGRGNRDQVRGNRRDWCMVDNLICCISSYGGIFWCEPDALDWREPEGIMCTKELRGLGSLIMRLFYSRVVHFGEQLIHRWDQYKINHVIPQSLGVSHELEDLLPGARMSTSGRNILLFWDVVQGDRLEIWCAEISLERQQGGHVRGNIEWSNAVMTVVDPFVDHYKVLHSLSVTL